MKRYKLFLLVPVLLCSTVYAGTTIQNGKDTLPITTFEEIPSVELNLDKAPPLRSVRVVTVRSSTQQTGEIIQPGQFITQRNHSGIILVQLLEMGYGTNIIAKINGQQLPISAQTNRLFMCANGAGGLRLCRRGEQAIGFLRTWAMQSAGNFTYELVSTNFPFTPASTWIVIT